MVLSVCKVRAQVANEQLVHSLYWVFLGVCCSETLAVSKDIVQVASSVCSCIINAPYSVHIRFFFFAICCMQDILHTKFFLAFAMLFKDSFCILQRSIHKMLNACKLLGRAVGVGV